MTTSKNVMPLYELPVKKILTLEEGERWEVQKVPYLSSVSSILSPIVVKLPCRCLPTLYCNVLLLFCVTFLIDMSCEKLSSLCNWFLLLCCPVGIENNGAEAYCRISRILGTLLNLTSISYAEVQTRMSASFSHSVVSNTRAAKPPEKLGGGRGIFAERWTQNTERCMTLKFSDYG